MIYVLKILDFQENIRQYTQQPDEYALRRINVRS